MVQADELLTVDGVAARRALVQTTTIDGNPGSAPAVNGIDYLEVTNVIDPIPSNDLSELIVRFVHPLTGADAAPSTPTIQAEHVTIRGGDRVVNPKVESVVVAGDTLTIRVRPIGDHSIYTLAMDNVGSWLDPQLSEVPFSFLVECPTRFDCGGVPMPVEPTPASPHLDYLARDYNSLRQMMLDRLAVTVPDWTERNPADLGVAVVEMLAHLGDRLAYGQDVVATEAYLDRARFRTSVARHLRLIDYHLHDGHNARAWLALDVSDTIVVAPGARFYTAIDGHPKVTSSVEVFEEAVAAGAEFFEAVNTTRHVPQHNRIDLHTWMDTHAVLPAGSTAATLRDPFGSLELRAGSYLLFEETADPNAASAAIDTSRRQVVRLTSVDAAIDPLDHRAGPSGLKLMRVCWASEDALRFDLTLGDATSAARGNLLLVDHGRTTRVPIRLPAATKRFRPGLPDRTIATSSSVFKSTTMPGSSVVIEALNEGRLDGGVRERLAEIDVELIGETVAPNGTGRWIATDHIWLVTIDEVDALLEVTAAPTNAAVLARPNPADATHEIVLFEHDQTQAETWDRSSPNGWLPVADLVRATADDQVFVVEVAEGGSASLRFGDDETGKQPNVGTEFDAVYRVGNGTAGNVGADTIAHLFAQTGGTAGATDRQTIFGPTTAINEVRNPLGATGGTDPESIVQARVRAPEVFTKQLRAVTPEDYAERLRAHPLVQRAVVQRQWTGSWSTLFCTVDLIGGKELDENIEAVLRRWVEPWRTMGHDLEIDEPLLVPIELKLCVGLHDATPRLSVHAELRSRLGTGVRHDGSLALFHPDRLTFGDRIYLSTIYNECQSVAGVVEVDIQTFRRLGSSDRISIDRGYVELLGREIAVLANDPNRPERGSLTIDVVGGR